PSTTPSMQPCRTGPSSGLLDISPIIASSSLGAGPDVGSTSTLGGISGTKVEFGASADTGASSVLGGISSTTGELGPYAGQSLMSLALFVGDPGPHACRFWPTCSTIISFSLIKYARTKEERQSKGKLRGFSRKL
ncbi:unnamed protein product, partial [Ilex paraguariensis]